MSATTMPSSLAPACLPESITADTYPARVGVISIVSPEVEEATELTDVDAVADAADAVVAHVDVATPIRQDKAWL